MKENYALAAWAGPPCQSRIETIPLPHADIIHWMDVLINPSLGGHLICTPPGCSPSLPLLKPKELNKSRRNTSLQSFSELQEVGKQKYTEDEYDPSGHFCSGSRELLHGGPCAPATPCDAEPMDDGQEHTAPTAIGDPRSSSPYLSHPSWFLAKEFQVDL